MLIHRRVVNNLIGNPDAEWGNVGEFRMPLQRLAPHPNKAKRLG